MKRPAPKASRRAQNPASDAGPRQKKKDQTRARILRVALDLFSSRGFYRTTTRQISRKAGIAEGTLFNYFATKEDLALYFFEQELEKLIQWFEREKPLRKAPLVEKLFAIVHRHLEQISPFEDFVGAVYLRALQPASKLHPISLDSQSLNLRYLRFIREVLAEAENEGEIPPVGDLGAWAFALFHVGIVSFWLHDASPGKERTLALLDRSLKVARTILRRGGDWNW
ncbi:MAG TPA: TetR/AcrR family transcriptional regulator [Verrucomicrobiae bacterium]|jgi:AcrR family transcriptional regulator|nr:TetR/AcrR family transcriptional regulator [Verrucomicrobiae bacterium]